MPRGALIDECYCEEPRLHAETPSSSSESPIDCEPPRVCVVLAAYDEAGNVGRLLQRLHTTLTSMQFPTRYVVVVQGTDGTLEEIEGLRDRLGNLVVSYSREPLGVGEAFRRAFALVSDNDDDLVATMDCDLDHHPEELPRFYAALRAHQAQIVVGSRYIASGRVEGSPAWKRWASRTMNRLITRSFRMPVTDNTVGYRLMQARVARQIAATTVASGFDFYAEFLVRAARAGARIVEVPMHFTYRTVGVSKMNKVATAVNYVRLFWRLCFGART